MTYAEANDAIFSLFWPGFRQFALDTLGYVPLAYWPDSKEEKSAPVDKVWIRVSRKTNFETLSGFNEGENQSIRRYDVSAILYIQLFYPQSDGNSTVLFPTICEYLKNSLQGKADATNVLWTKDVKIDELSSEKSWFRKNVVCEFTYQEIKR